MFMSKLNGKIFGLISVYFPTFFFFLFFVLLGCIAIIFLMFGILHKSELQMISQVRNRLAGVICLEKV